ncbi:MAG: biopolymer transporter ExbD [candidate division KSB1 bacterium]|nr:biopolymer transporter ExbD [candidate division KSB1 bacterium]
MRKEKYRTTYNAQIELPTLVDVVFLLLVFFLCTLTTAGKEEKTPAPPSDLDLPRTQEQISPLNDSVLETLLIHIVNLDEQGGKAIYFLWPDSDRSRTEKQAIDEINRQLRAQPPDSQYYAEIRDVPAFLKTIRKDRPNRSAATIESNLTRYITNMIDPSMGMTPIEVRAVRNTEFGLINYFFNLCNEITDDPSVNPVHMLSFRVLTS